MQVLHKAFNIHHCPTEQVVPCINCQLRSQAAIKPVVHAASAEPAYCILSEAENHMPPQPVNNGLQGD